VNTEVYSWDTSFCHVDPRLGYPCGQVVFCVNLGTLFKGFLQLVWGLTGVRLDSNSVFPECSPNVPRMFPECSPLPPFRYQTSLNQFLNVFDDAIREAPADKNPQRRTFHVISKATFATWAYVTRGQYCSRFAFSCSFNIGHFIFLLFASLFYCYANDSPPSVGFRGTSEVTIGYCHLGIVHQSSLLVTISINHV
jgi:hypothetical protein